MTCIDEEQLAQFLDGGLVDDEIRLHLRECQRCEAVLLEAVALATEAADRRERPHAPDTPRYVLHELLGRGAAGLVFRATDQELHRTVAIKLVHAAVDAHSLVHEARALAQLSHPNVVQVYDVVSREDSVFLTMEYVEGGTYRQWVDAAPSLEAQAHALLDVAEGLRAIHQAGLVHRDLKPANVLVGRDGRVRVADFGLSGAQTAAIRGGTPRYMAPEQRDGAAATERSDQYSFGVMLSETLASADVSALQRRLHTVAERALQLRPADRFASMDEVIAALQRALRGSGRDHYVATRALLVLLCVAHAGLLGAMIYFTLKGAEPPPTTGATFGSLSFGSKVFGILVACNGFWCFLFAPLAAILMPLGTIGFWRRRAWARPVLLVYAVLALPFCPTALPAAYLFYALSRSALRAELA
ncbi:MAG: serine/threonine-protein kinase [Myxococcota bacterium]